MISTIQTKTISEPIPYGENSRTHPVIRFALKAINSLNGGMLAPTVLVLCVLYFASFLWIFSTVYGGKSLLYPSFKYISLIALLPFVVVNGFVLENLRKWGHRVYHQCYDGATRQLFIETIQVEGIERLIRVADLEDFGPGYLGRTRDQEYFFLMSQNLFDLLNSIDDGTTESEVDEYPTRQLPEVLELTLASNELIGVRGSGSPVLADELEMVSVCDLPLKEFLSFCILPREGLSAEVLTMFETAEESMQ